MTTPPLPFVELQVVGAVLADPELFAQAAFIDPDGLSDESLKVVWRLIRTCVARGRNFTPATLALSFPDEIEPLGGALYLNRLAQKGESVLQDFGCALDRLHQEQQWRRIQRMALRLQSAIESREKSPDQVLSGLADLTSRYLSAGPDTVRSKRDVARNAIEEAQRERRIVTTGIDNLDYLMQGGLQSRRLYGIGGLYGRGKTILLGTISDNLNLQEEPHLFISMETPPEDIEIRNCARHLRLNSASIHDRGDENYDSFLEAADNYIEALPNHMVYDYAPQAMMDEIHRKILVAKSRNKIRGFILDYWQLIQGRERGQSQDDHLRSCSDRLAAICRQEDLWGILTAQVDELGRPKYSDGIYHSTSLYVRLVREEDDSAAYFITEKSNYTRYGDTGNESITGMIFDQHVGPHFRNTEATDIGDLAREDAINL